MPERVASAAAATRSGGPEEKLRALTLSFMRLYVGAQDSHKALLNELDNLAPGVRSELIGKQRRIIAAVEALILELKPGTGPLALPLTMLFFGMINWTHTWFRPHGRVSAESLADMAVDLMLNGLSSPTLSPGRREPQAS